ncbi:NARE ribosyltransferase, partial [Daphoenositta chrysoptera]|nr:NARE ribosyltransferase [Daphoenositta chrysoptera]
WPLSSMAPLAHTLALLAMAVATAAINVVHMNMAPDSFDDQYKQCHDQMMAALPALNRSEQQQNKNFSQVWAKATAAWQKKMSSGSPLSPDQAIAIMAYTMDDVYSEFNKAVRTAGRSGQQYRHNFHFKTLHFLLTDALAVLRPSQQCRDVYRGVRETLFEAKPGDTVRFGQFTSTSLLKRVAEGFGTVTTFRVHTCQGVAIWDYSEKYYQQEVLIPPFETFRVTKFTRKGNTAEIELRSTGTHSNYDCELLLGDSTGTTWG